MQLTGHYVHKRGLHLAGLMCAALLLQLAAAVGLSYVIGFAKVRSSLDGFDPLWLIALAAGLLISVFGYYFAYRAIYRVDGGPRLSREHMRSVVIAGFGGFLARGGAALDEYALDAAGADERDAKVRTAALAGFEHGVLAIGGCVAAVIVLASGLAQPPADFSVPWAVIPLPGFAVAFWAAERFRARLAGAHGWRGKAGIFLDSIHLVRLLFAEPGRYWPALGGMALFWVGDGFAGWSGLAAFGLKMNAAAFAVGFATGMVFTRRTGPLAGAGVLVLVLPLTLWYSGAGFAVALLGMFAYRFLAVWLPMPFALRELPRLRRLGADSSQDAPDRARAPSEPSLPG